MRRVDLHPYRTSWPEEFENAAAVLRADLGHRPIRIDHIGSTSISGMAAKNVIDMQVLTASIDDAEDFVEVFTRLGFEYRQDQWNQQDHIPAGWRGPDSEWAKLVFSAPERRWHAHVRVTGRANARYALLFRDYLRANPAAARAWSAFKQTLAEWFPDDRDAYGQIKDPATDVLMCAAEQWAEITGWKLCWDPS